MKSAIECLKANLPALEATAKIDSSQSNHVEDFKAAIAALEKASEKQPAGDIKG